MSKNVRSGLLSAALLLLLLSAVSGMVFADDPAPNPAGPAVASGREATSTVEPMAVAAAVPADELWDDRFGLAGVNDAVHAILVHGDHVYVGGDFETAGGKVAAGVARYDTRTRRWHGFHHHSDLGSVQDIEVIGDDIYLVAGNHLLRWDRIEGYWRAVGEHGLQGSVSVIAAIGTDLYVGGHFLTFDRRESYASLLKWDSIHQEWSSLAVIEGENGLGSVMELAVRGSELYVAGSFIAVDGEYMDNIARLDTASGAWSALGAGIGSSGNYGLSVRSMAVDASGNVYVVGTFNRAGTAEVHGAAWWDAATQSWSAWGQEIRCDRYGCRGELWAVAAYGHDVYAGGEFTLVGEQRTNSIAQWKDGAWSILGEGVMSYDSYYRQVTPGNVYAIGAGPGGVFAGGYFDSLGDENAFYIAGWDGDNWISLSDGSVHGIGESVGGGHVYALAYAPDGDLYAGGQFGQIGTITTTNIARWDGERWWPVGGGVDGTVYSIVVDGSKVYVGGDFGNAGGAPAGRLAVWDSATQGWSDAGASVACNQYSCGASVRSIALDGTDLYIGGRFTHVGEVAANNVARLDRSTGEWTALGGGTDGQVNAVAVAGDRVYAGGDFLSADGRQSKHIARWNGTAWSSIGGMTCSWDCGGETVRAMAVRGDELYVAGSFDRAGLTQAGGVARWDNDTATWSPLPGFYGYANAIALSGDDVIVGGHRGNLQRWNANDSGRWFGSGVGARYNLSISAVAARGKEVFVGGEFSWVGGKASHSIARWDGSAMPVVVNTLVDDVTGQPLRNITGSLNTFLDQMTQLTGSFTTDSSGVFTHTIEMPAGRSVRLLYHSLDGYGSQFYNGKFSFETADPVTLNTGLNRLTTRLAPLPTLVGTLLDDATGQPVANTNGTLTVHYRGGQWYSPESAYFTTDAAGLYTVTLNSVPLGAPTWLEFNVTGYPIQGRGVFNPYLGEPYTFQAGPNSLAARLMSTPTAGVTPTEGGMVTTKDGSASVTLPPGAVSGPATLVFTPTTELPFYYGVGYTAISGFTVEVRPEGGEPLSQTEGMYTIVISYSDEQLAAKRIGEASLNVAYYQSDAYEWVPLLPCAGCSIDYANNRITIVTDRLGNFALIGFDVVQRGLFVPLLKR